MYMYDMLGEPLLHVCIARRPVTRHTYTTGTTTGGDLMYIIKSIQDATCMSSV